MAETHGDKSLDPTPHRRQQAREQGQVARSQDLSSALLCLGMLGLLAYAGPTLAGVFSTLVTDALSGQGWLAALDGQPGGDFVVEQWQPLVRALSGALLPLLALTMVLAIVSNVLQTGLLFLPGKMMPDLSRINPLEGLGRIFSPASTVRLAFGLIKLGVAGSVAAACLYQRREDLFLLPGLDLPELAAGVWQICLSTCVKISAALVVLAVLDYAYQRWKFERDLRMTPQELREEMRNLQGDPQVTARRRAVERQLAAGRFLQAVPQADVIIVDAADAAVALRYDADRAAPLVIAKGTGPLAQRIQSLAGEHGVPIVERGSLARALYEQIEINRPITRTHYTAVAEVLAGAMRARQLAA